MIGDEASEKFVNYSFHATGQISFAVLRGICRAIINKHKKTKAEKEYAPGEKSMDKLTKTSAKEQSPVICTSVSKKELHGLDKYAKKYGIRFSLVREKNDPSHYIFSFLQKDMSKLDHALSDFLKDGQDHGDLEKKIHEAQKEAFTVNQAHKKERGPRAKAPHQKAGPNL